MLQMRKVHCNTRQNHETRKANTSLKNVPTCPHKDHVPCKSQCYGWVGGTARKIMNQKTHTHPISVKQNNGIQVSSHV